MDITEKERLLQEQLRGYGRVALGFSGGVDSTLLLRVALDTLGKRNVLAVIADTPSLPRRELAEALHLADTMGATCVVIKTEEMSDPAYSENPSDRCYCCKHHLFARIAELAAAKGIAHLLDGNNADDVGDYRPGRRAAQQLGVKSPLLDAGLTKREIRELSRRLGLPTADKPAMACLASRVPYGTPITRELLAQIEQAENVLHDAGFPECRVRHHDRVARIEVPPDEIARLTAPETREAVVCGIKAAGYAYVALDLQGYRTGSLNESVAIRTL